MRVRARQDVVNVGRVARSVDDLALFVQSDGLPDVVAVTLRVAMQLIDVRRDDDALRVVPGTAADAVARVDGQRRACGSLAEIRAPGPAARTGGLRQRLTVLVGARQATQVRAIAEAHTADEEAHRRLGSLGRGSRRLLRLN